MGGVDIMTYGIISDSLVVSSDDKRALDALRGLPVLKKHGGNTGTKANKGKFIMDCIAAFDTETSTIDLPDGPQAFTYVWQMQINEDLTIIGRTWPEFFELLEYWDRYLPEACWLVIWVQNLAYEFQFMSGVYPFKSGEVFAVDSRKPLYCKMMGRYEFRCAYLHSNMSLAAFGKKWNTKHRKLVGDLDYGLVRYPWTPLKDDELPYMVNDVVVLVEALRAEMEAEKVDLYTIPKTSTGWVRKDVKNAMRKVRSSYIKDQQPDFDLYVALREAFRGGNAHASRFYAGDTVHNVASVDESSAYPFVLTCCEYPVSPFFFIDTKEEEEIQELIGKKKALVMRVALWYVDLQDPLQGCPYLTIDKCRNVKRAVIDNGRIISADYLETTMTDIDYGIISRMYRYLDFHAFHVWRARYGMLQPALRMEICKYYSMKTGMKGVPGMETYYQKSKARLNSIYGMMAQNPVKQTISYLDGEFIEGEKLEPELLANYTRRAFTCYQWGVWCTAHSRAMLQEGIDACGTDFVYTDTDSVKYRYGDPNIEARFREINERRRALAEKWSAWAYDPAGNAHYMGVFESEGVYAAFKTMGAKKYIAQYPDGPILCTIAGVNKKLGGPELEAAGGFDAFREGFTFVEAGGTESFYNDLQEPLVLAIDSHELVITSNVVIAPSTYTLGITEDYRRILEDADTLLKTMRLHGMIRE